MLRTESPSSRGSSLVEQLLPLSTREAVLSTLSPEEAETIARDWRLWARPEQLEPAGDDWLVWLILSGRGWGKTRTGSEFVRSRALPGARIAIVARTAADARDVLIEGESGILACSPSWCRPLYEP